MIEIHQDQPILIAGDDGNHTERIVILLHGRGATAKSMLPITEALAVEKTRYLIPQAADNRWYPQTAFGPLEVNEPDLSSALKVIKDLIKQSEDDGFHRSQIFLGGFSQGACLAAEFIARNPAKYGGLFVLSGALIGPPDLSRNPVSGLEGTKVFIGGSNVDPWVQESLFHKASQVFKNMGAEVDLQIYTGLGHSINQEEIKKVRDLITGSNQPHKDPI
jgi:predicted esterase